MWLEIGLPPLHLYIKIRHTGGSSTGLILLSWSATPQGKNQSQTKKRVSQPEKMDQISSINARRRYRHIMPDQQFRFKPTNTSCPRRNGYGHQDQEGTCRQPRPDVRKTSKVCRIRHCHRPPSASERKPCQGTRRPPDPIIQPNVGKRIRFRKVIE